MMHILYATDGSSDALAAGRMLETWPLAGSARTTVLTVVPPLSFFNPELLAPTSAGWAEVPRIVEEESEHANRIAEAAVLRLRERGVEAETVVRHGPPAREILQALESLAPDLVVLGSHGQSRLAQALIGSASQTVAKHAACSALVVRDGNEWRGRVVLAVDGSPESETATQFLACLPLPSPCECTVLHALEPLLDPGDLRVPQRLAAAEHLVERSASTLATARLSALPRVQEGHAAQEILRAVKEVGADMVVVGARGISGIREFLLGSVSGRVLRYAPCSVLIAR